MPSRAAIQSVSKKIAEFELFAGGKDLALAHAAVFLNRGTEDVLLGVVGEKQGAAVGRDGDAIGFLGVAHDRGEGFGFRFQAEDVLPVEFLHFLGALGEEERRWLPVSRRATRSVR